MLSNKYCIVYFYYHKSISFCLILNLHIFIKCHYLFIGLSIFAMPVPGSDFGLRDRPGQMEIKITGLHSDMYASIFCTTTVHEARRPVAIMHKIDPFKRYTWATYRCGSRPNLEDGLSNPSECITVIYMYCLILRGIWMAVICRPFQRIVREN